MRQYLQGLLQGPGSTAYLLGVVCLAAGLLLGIGQPGVSRAEKATVPMPTNTPLPAEPTATETSVLTQSLSATAILAATVTGTLVPTQTVAPTAGKPAVQVVEIALRGSAEEGPVAVQPGTARQTRKTHSASAAQPAVDLAQTQSTGLGAELAASQPLQTAGTNTSTPTWTPTATATATARTVTPSPTATWTPNPYPGTGNQVTSTPLPTSTPLVLTSVVTLTPLPTRTSTPIPAVVVPLATPTAMIITEPTASNPLPTTGGELAGIGPMLSQYLTYLGLALVNLGVALRLFSPKR